MVGCRLGVLLELLRLRQRVLDLLLDTVDEGTGRALGLLRALRERRAHVVHAGPCALLRGRGGIARGRKFARAEIADGGLRLLREAFGHVVGGLRLRENRIAVLLGLARNVVDQFAALGLRVLERLFRISEAILHVSERVLRLVLRPGIGVIDEILAVLLQRLHLGEQRLDVALGAVHERADDPLRVLGALVKLRLHVIDAGLRDLARLVGRGLRVVERTLREVLDGGLRLVDDRLRGVVGCLRLGEHLLAERLGLGGNRLLELCVLRLRVVERLVDLREDAVRAVERALRLVLRPGRCVVRDILAVLDKLLRFHEERVDVRLCSIDEIRDHRLRVVGRGINVLLGLIDSGLRVLVGRVDGGARFFERTLGKIFDGSLRLVDHALRGVVGLLRLRKNLLAKLLGLNGNLLEQLLVLGLHVVVGLLDLGELRLRLIECALRLVLGPRVCLIDDVGTKLQKLLAAVEHGVDCRLRSIDKLRDDLLGLLHR